MPTSGHPYAELAGPPTNMPNPKSVRQPERIEMIVNETAKLEKAPIPRLSSWAYPSSWSFSTSVLDPPVAAVPLEASSMLSPLPPNGWRNDSGPLRTHRAQVSRSCERVRLRPVRRELSPRG